MPTRSSQPADPSSQQEAASTTTVMDAASPCLLDKPDSVSVVPRCGVRLTRHNEQSACRSSRLCVRILGRLDKQPTLAVVDDHPTGILYYRNHRFCSTVFVWQSNGRTARTSTGSTTRTRCMRSRTPLRRAGVRRAPRPRSREALAVHRSPADTGWAAARGHGGDRSTARHGGLPRDGGAGKAPRSHEGPSLIRQAPGAKEPGTATRCTTHPVVSEQIAQHHHPKEVTYQ